MKFEKRFFFSVIPEWKDQYIALEALLKQIESVKNAALKLVQSIANIKKLEKGREVNVDLHAIRPDKVFWEMLEENLHKVETFYETQLSSFLEQFHNLTLQAVLLDKIEEYIPFNPGQNTKLERELGRLPNNKDMPIGVLGVDEVVHRPVGTLRLIHLDKQTNMEHVKEELRRLKPAIVQLRNSGERKSKGAGSSPSPAPGSYRNVTVTGSSIEDHLRDFQYASAQLQGTQLEHEHSLPTEMGYNPVYTQNGNQTIQESQQRIRRERSDIEAGTLRRHGALPNGFSPHDVLAVSAPIPHDYDLNGNPIPYNPHALAPNRMDSDYAAQTAAHLNALRHHLHLGSSDSSLQQHAVHESIRAQQNGLPNGTDWKRDTFFDSSDSDMAAPTPVHPSPHPSGHQSDFRGHSSDSDDGMMNPPIKMRRSASNMTGGSSGPSSARQALKGTASGYSSFFGSEDDESDLEPPGDLEDVPLRASMDSNGASSTSKDSGYDSGQSFEGFVEENQTEEQEERVAATKAKDPDSETTGSRHSHVPETRLRRRTARSASWVPGAGLEPSGSAVSLPKISATPNLSVPAHRSPSPSVSSKDRPSTLKTETLGDNTTYQSISVQNDARVSSDVQPLLPAQSNHFGAFPQPPRSRSDSPVNEVEMVRLDTPSRAARRGGRELEVSHEPEVLVPPEEYGRPQPLQREDTHVELDLGDHHQPDAPPRTRFYQMPDPRQINRDKAIRGLQNGFSELYRGLHLLKRYAELNVEATDKILAKYEKNVERGHRVPFMRDVMGHFNFNRGQELRSLISQTEHVYAQAFTGGHRTPAMQKLRVPEEEEDMESTTLRFGLLFGLSLGFALIILYMTIVVRSTVVQKMRPDLIVYRMLFISTLMLWYWGVDMWIWASYRVNYPFIFEFNTRGHIRHQNVFDIASVFTVVLIGDMMLYMLSALQRYDSDFFVPGFEFLRHVPPEIYPLFLVVQLLALLIFYSFKSGFWLVRTLGRIITAPLYKVVFRDFFLADQLVSISIVLQDIDFTICYFATSAFRGGGNSCATNHLWMSPILSTLPSVWRLLQCFRRYYDSKDKVNLYNAGKYLTGMLVAIASSMRSIVKSTPWLVIWLVLVVVATVYSYAWDIYKDWSIGDRKSANWMLRDQLLYPKWWYYVAALANLVLRLMWTLTISPTAIASVLFLGKDGFTTLLVIVEVSRRAMWNIFRLENEQLNNCGRFRAVQDIPLPLPLKPAVEENLYQDQLK